MFNALNLPWSGPVTQDINPWTWWIRTLNQPFGFVNINTYQSSDLETERRIVGDVAGYGRQLGRVMDALDVAVGHLDSNTLSNSERAAIEDFRELHQKIQRVKDDVRDERLSPSNLRRLIADLTALKETNPDGYERIAATLRAVI